MARGSYLRSRSSSGSDSGTGNSVTMRRYLDSMRVTVFGDMLESEATARRIDKAYRDWSAEAQNSVLTCSIKLVQ